MLKETTLDKKTVLDALAEVVVAPNIELVLRPLDGVPDLRAEGDRFVCGRTGHGVASMFFRLLLKTRHLLIDVTLPCLRGGFAGVEVRRRDDRAVRTACQLALTILGSEKCPAADERLEVSVDAQGDCRWKCLFLDTGEVKCAGTGCPELIDQLRGDDLACAAIGGAVLMS